MSEDKFYPKNFPIPPEPISRTKLEDILTKELPKWEEIETTLPKNPAQPLTEIYREFVFENFDHAMDFIRKAQPYFNFIPHHPRLENIWRIVRVYLTTWDAGHKITFKDIIVARNLEKLYNKKFHKKYDYAKKRVEEIPIDPKQEAFVKDLKNKIGEGEIKAVFELLDHYYIRNERIKKPNKVLKIQSKYNTLIQDKNKGTITHEQFSVGMAQVVDELLNDVLDVSILLKQ